MQHVRPAIHVRKADARLVAREPIRRRRVPLGEHRSKVAWAFIGGVFVGIVSILILARL